VDRHRIAIVAGATVVLFGCAHPAPPLQNFVPPEINPTTSTTARPHLTLSERDDRTTVRVRRGTTITVVLHSTFWQLSRPTDSIVLRATGDPMVAPQPAGCVAGGGCGTVTARYVADAPGSSSVFGHRASCGEALVCEGRAGQWEITVVVNG
jgi:hypothetical protein